MSPGHERRVLAPQSGQVRQERAEAAASDPGPAAAWPPPVAITRTPQGWSVVSAFGADPVGDLIEGLSLADLVTEESGAVPEPDRTARRSARGSADPAAHDAADPVAARLAALERTVSQLEHALAARVATERAIGVLAERHGTTPRSAFEGLRRDARSQGRAVHELAREVLDGLTTTPPPAQGADTALRTGPAARTPVEEPPAPARSPLPSTDAATDGGS